MKTAIIILAAGNSSRMGQLKQLMPWKDTTLLGNAIRMARNSNADSIYVVLGAQADKIKETIKEDGINTITNKQWAQGMGATISYGVDQILKSGCHPEAMLIMVADQPNMDFDFLNSLIDKYAKGKSKIVATQYADKLGVPAIFDKQYFPRLLQLQGEEGASQIIKNNRNDCFGLNAGKKVIDLDTLNDYHTYKALDQ
jgi:molybdenum cofactor cytidylyltransferase